MKVVKKGRRIQITLLSLFLCVIIIPSGLLIAQSVHAQSTDTWAGAWTVGIYYYGGWEEPPAWYISFNLEQNGSQVRANPPILLSSSGNDFRFELQGVARGNLLEGTLSWDDFGKGDRVASFTFTMSDDGLSFRGALNVAEHSFLMGNWLGTRENIPTSQPPGEHILIVKIETDKTEYKVGEKTTTTITVLDNATGAPIERAEILIKTYKQSDPQYPKTGNSWTDKSGKTIYVDYWRDVQDVGVWITEVTASKDGYPDGSNRVTFKVLTDKMFNVLILTDKKQYMISEKATLTITVLDKATGAPIPAANLLIEQTANTGEVSELQAKTNENGQWSHEWTWDAEEVGAWTIKVTASKDGYPDGSGSVTVEVLQNTPPTVKLTYTPELPVIGDTVLFKAVASDPDKDPLTYEWFLDDLKLDVTGSEYGIDVDNEEPFTVKVKVSDGKGGIVEDSVEIVTGQLGNLGARITTLQRVYMLNELAEFTAFVFDTKDNQPVANADLHITIIDNKGETRTVEEKSNADGEYKWEWEWKANEAGTWVIEVEASKAGFGSANDKTQVTVIGEGEVTFRLDVEWSTPDVLTVELADPIRFTGVIYYKGEISEPTDCEGLVELQDTGYTPARTPPFRVRAEGESEWSLFRQELPVKFTLSRTADDWEEAFRIDIEMRPKFSEVSTTLNLVITLNKVQSASQEGKPVAYTPDKLEKAVPLVVEIDPAIKEAVKVALAKKWEIRWALLAEQMAKDGKPTVAATFVDVYNWLEGHESIINAAAIGIQITAKMSSEWEGDKLSLIATGVDNFEDVIDAGKGGYLLYVGYQINSNDMIKEGLLDLAFKFVPDVAAGAIAKGITSGLVIYGTAKGAAVGTAVGGGSPIGTFLGGVIGAVGAYKFGNFIECKLELGSYIIEKWWQENKQEMMTRWGIDSYDDFRKWVKAGSPNTTKEDVARERLLGIFATHSEGFLNIYDSQGRHTGPDGQGGFEAEIPGLYCIYFEETKVTLFAAGINCNPIDEYRFEVEGVETGHYSLGVVAASIHEVKTLVDIKDAEMQSGKTYSTEVDTRTTFPNADTTPPVISDLALSTASVSANQTVSVSATITDDSRIYSVFAAVIQNDNILTYGPLKEEAGKYSGEVMIPPDTLDGMYLIQVSAYDKSGNTATSNVELTVSGGDAKQTNTVTRDSTGEFTETTSTSPGGGGAGGAILLFFIIIAIPAIILYRRRKTSVPGKKPAITTPISAPSSCIKCGREIPAGSECCQSCGRKQGAGGPIYCEECGKPFPEGNPYCPHCGDKQGAA